ASTSELFGNARTSPQDEETPFRPRSPYAIAKLYAHHITVNYREAFGLHASCGILFNHESPLRSPQFITRKVTLAMARMSLGEDASIEGLDQHTGRLMVRVNPAFYRPADIRLTVGNPAKAADRLGWKAKLGFGALIRLMIEADLKRLKKGEITL